MTMMLGGDGVGDLEAGGSLCLIAGGASRGSVSHVESAYSVLTSLIIGEGGGQLEELEIKVE
jgi:hypothetical protein